MKAVVLCAGFGTRLGALTREIPKPMLPVAGKPVLAYILCHLRAHGFRDVAINLHFQPHVVRDHFGDGAALGLRLRYFDEPALLGTAGALRNMRAFLDGSDSAGGAGGDGDDSFFVQYGDVVTDQDLTALVQFHRARAADATLLLHQRARSNSVVAMNDDRRIVGFLERPSEAVRATLSGPWVNSGLAVCHRRLLDWIPAEGPSDIPRDVIVPHVASGRIYGFALSGYRCAIDSPERYAAVQQALASGAVFAGGSTKNDPPQHRYAS